MVYMLRCYSCAFVLSFTFTLINSTEVYAAETARGAQTFLKYCAGCHGFDGKANYEHAPSFSLGDRMQKDDQELLQSVLNGKNNMPPWRDKLPVEKLRDAITYLRLMHSRHERGDQPRQIDIPDTYYLFKPVGEENMDWMNETVIVPEKSE